MRTLLAAFWMLSFVAACSKDPAPAAKPTGETAAAVAVADNGLTQVTDTSQVCMVNDQYMGKAQIPVEVEGKTYFGCCEMCKGRLASEPATRQATDPVTGAPVDKATAVIGRQADGKVLYFASAESFAKYRAP